MEKYWGLFSWCGNGVWVRWVEDWRAYVGDEGVPFLLAEKGFKVVEEREAFLVGDAGEGVIGVFAIEVDD